MSIQVNLDLMMVRRHISAGARWTASPPTCWNMSRRKISLRKASDRPPTAHILLIKS